MTAPRWPQGGRAITVRAVPWRAFAATIVGGCPSDGRSPKCCLRSGSKRAGYRPIPIGANSPAIRPTEVLPGGSEATFPGRGPLDPPDPRTPTTPRPGRRCSNRPDTLGTRPPDPGRGNPTPPSADPQPPRPGGSVQSGTDPPRSTRRASAMASDREVQSEGQDSSPWISPWNQTAPTDRLRGRVITKSTTPDRLSTNTPAVPTTRRPSRTVLLGMKANL